MPDVTMTPHFHLLLSSSLFGISVIIHLKSCSWTELFSKGGICEPRPLLTASQVHGSTLLRRDPQVRGASVKDHLEELTRSTYVEWSVVLGLCWKGSHRLSYIRLRIQEAFVYILCGGKLNETFIYISVVRRELVFIYQ